MTPDTQTSTTLIRIREAQAALDRATAAMDTLQEGLSAVESVRRPTRRAGTPYEPG